MAKTEAFDEHADDYEAWFDAHPAAYASELSAVRVLLPREGAGVEIGVGTGRFAAALGIKHGIEPSSAMRAVAEARGIDVVDAVAEALPFPSRTLDYALMVTTVCFLDNVEQAFRETRRVLKDGGLFVVGLIDRTSPLGQRYEQRRARCVFYREARFHSAVEIAATMRGVGFEDLRFRQTIFGDPAAMEVPDPPAEGCGDGAFVVIRGQKPR